MTWVAWRQQRLLTVVSLGLVAVVAAGMGALWVDASTHSGRLADRYGGLLGYIPLVMLALPVLLGMFAGAPVFARDVEQGTHVFALTQSIGRTRWWATKLLVAGVPVTIAMTLLGLLNAKALEPVGFLVSNRLQTPMFESQGLVLGVYTAAAFALGATAGLLVRTTLGAMATTLAGYLGLLVLVGNAARPRYATPLESTTPELGAWNVGRDYVDARGQHVPFSYSGCATEDVQACLADHGVVGQVLRYHPVSRFWDFQLIESGLVVVVVVALLGVGAWAVRRVH